MTDALEKTKKVVELTGVTYADARDALERAEWDVLSAVILLEQDGKVATKTASYSTERRNSPSDEMLQSQKQWEESTRRTNVSETMGNVWEKVKRFLMIPLVIERRDSQVAVIPMFLVLVILCTFRTLALLGVIVSLFFGVRYKFDGIETVTFDVNETMGHMADVAESIANNGDTTTESQTCPTAQDETTAE